MAEEEENIICENCPACGEIMRFYKLGFLKCPCGSAEAELTINWRIIEDNEIEDDED